MERRFELRKEAMLAECEVSPQVFLGVDRFDGWSRAQRLAASEDSQH